MSPDTPLSSQDRPSPLHRWFPHRWRDHELLDCGGGARLERFGELVLIRPEPRAIWERGMDESQWRRLSAAEFIPTGRTKGQWVPHQSVPDTWEIQYPLHTGKNLHFSLEMTRFKHVGIFPEQGANWDWIAQRMGPGKRLLNLFAYTGGASLAGRAAGAEVTHVDAIKQVVSWTRTNQELSGLDGIRWCVEDALKFSEREGRRGNQYDLVIMDPPSWGLGPKGEKWKLEEQVLRLVSATSKLVAPGGAVIMNTYSGVSPSALENMWRAVLPDAKMEAGELCLRSGTGQVLPTGSLLRLERP
ncbi:class I SAM-dependent methyltransferase [Flavobacteriales bacterium]|nr:class I SAM-dependent methyltransferase [Flavobacteriales bacterium]